MWVGGFFAAVKEVGDVRIFFGFGHSRLRETVSGNNLPEEIFHFEGCEKMANPEAGEVALIRGHGKGFVFGSLRTGE
jgi:hypothetical protein